MTQPPSATGTVVVTALTGVPEIASGTDLAAVVVDALARSGLTLLDGDVLVVTSKIVSKARGLTAPLDEREEVIASQTVRVVAERLGASGITRVVEGRAGTVAAAAGVDASNTGRDARLLLLPVEPDAEASTLHRHLLAVVPGVRFGVIISDTAGRPWRAGQTDFALGASGIRAIDDYRGTRDADGRELVVTARAVADELAAAADLVKGKVSGMPVALIRGAGQWVGGGDGGARHLLRRGPEDWFAMGHVEAARASLGVLPGSTQSEAVGVRTTWAEHLSARVARAMRIAAAAERDEVSVALDGGDVVVTGADSYAVGRRVARLEVALWSESLAWVSAREGAATRIVVSEVTSAGG